MERMAGGLQQLFLYNGAADAIATVAASGYFNAMKDELGAGDVIMCVCGNNATIDNAVVTSARGATPVTVITAEGITAT